MSTDSLRALSDRELQLYKQTSAFEGTIEAKRQQLDASDIGEAYKQIHREYWQLVERTTDEAVRLEALKRVIFLNWYVMTEPSIYTGLDEVDLLVVNVSSALLDRYLAEQRLDAEFRWMLSVYAHWDYALLYDNEHRLPALRAFVRAVDAVDPAVSYAPDHTLPKHTMDNRGQMGIYWQSTGVEEGG